MMQLPTDININALTNETRVIVKLMSHGVQMFQLREINKIHHKGEFVANKTQTVSFVPGTSSRGAASWTVSISEHFAVV